MKFRIAILIYIFFTLSNIFAQNNGFGIIQEAEISGIDDSIQSMKSKNTSVTQKRTYKISEDSLESPVKYVAEDSIVYDIPAKKIYLYGHARIEYEKVNIKADSITFDWDKNEVYATMHQILDDTLVRKVRFTDGENNFEADALRFNLKTLKGKSYGMITRFDEGYLHGEQIKVVNDSTLYAKGAKYTTCEYEHPHYYIEVGKAKIIKDKLIVGTSADLVIADVHTPFFLPFAIYPTIKERTSGFILPRWGQSANQGFFLLGGGYYWAINDKMDLQATADIYTRGSWGVQATYNYVKKYKFSNSINIGINSIRESERQSPSKSKPSRQFNVLWNFQIDPRKMYNSSFSGSINVVSNTYNQLNINSDRTTVLNNQFTSTIAYNKQFKGKYPSQLSLNINHSQNTQTKQISITLPSISYSLNRIMPFKRKVQSSVMKWYENIGFNYNLVTSNQITATDSTFFSRQTLDDMRGGLKHSAPLSGNFNLLKYLNFSYNFDYTSRWYYRYQTKFYDDTPDTLNGRPVYILTQDKYGFKMIRDFGLSGGFNTRLYGIMQFKKGKLKAIRHVFSPSLNYRFRPDFSQPRWKYYDYVQSDTSGNKQLYSFYQNNIYGTASRGKEAAIGLSFSNNIEIKRYSKKDTITHTKKIPILDNFGLSLFYNFAKDSQNLEPLSFSGNTKILEYVNITFNGSLDWYTYDKYSNNRLKTYRITTDKRLTRLTNFNISINGAYTSKQHKDKMVSQTATNYALDDKVFNQPIASVNFEVPWSVRYGYNFYIRKFYSNGKDTSSITQAINLSGELNITPKWKVSIATGFDITQKKISRTDISVYRDLHCWQLAFNWIPLGIQKSFSIRLNVKSQALSFLQLNKRKSWFDY